MKAIAQAARSVLHVIPNILIVGLMALLPHLVLAAQVPEIERGLTWLKQQVQAEGTLASEEASVATPYQVRTETHGTLKRLGDQSWAGYRSIEPHQGLLLKGNADVLVTRAHIPKRKGRWGSSLI